MRRVGGGGGGARGAQIFELVLFFSYVGREGERAVVMVIVMAYRQASGSTTYVRMRKGKEFRLFTQQ